MGTIVTVGVLDFKAEKPKTAPKVDVCYDTDGGVWMRVNQMGDEIVLKLSARSALAIADLLTRAAELNSVPALPVT